MKNHLLLDFYEIDQKFLEVVFRDYGKLPDYYCTVDHPCIGMTRATLCVLANILAEAINFTLIAPGHPSYEDNGLHPKIYPALQELDNENRTVTKVWSNYFSCVPPGKWRRKEAPELIKTQFLDLNFVYCAAVQKQHDSIWEFSLFTDPFDFWIWMGLLVALVLVSWLAFSSFKGNGALSFQVVSSLEPLLSPGIGGFDKKSLLFVLWMLTTMVLVIFYSGVLTSVVISPSPEVSLETVSDLEKNNYSFILPNSVWIRLIQAISMASLSGNLFTPMDYDHVRRIAKSNEIRIYRSYPKFLFEMSSVNEKVASFMMWPLALRTASLAANVISAEEASASRKIKKRKCYVGKKMVRVGEAYLAVTPPGSMLLGSVFRRLVDSGIAGRWWDEFIAMGYSMRVQDRRRVISPTEILSDEGNIFEELRLEGDTVTIFLLWTGCLVICLVTFGFEFVPQKRKIISVQTIQSL